MATIAAARTAFRAQRATRRPRKPRTSLLVAAAKLIARVLPRWATLRRFALHLGGFAAISYASWLIARPAGLIAIGVSLLLLDFLAGDR